MGIIENIQNFKSDTLRNQAAKLNMLGYKISRGNNWSFVFAKDECSNIYTDAMKAPDVEGIDIYRYIILNHFVLRKEMYYISPGGKMTETPYFDVFVESPSNGENLVGNYIIDTRFIDYDNSLIIVNNNSILDRFGNLTELPIKETITDDDSLHIHLCPTKPENMRSLR